MSQNDYFVLTWDPVLPWSLPRVGLPLLFVVAFVLAGLTLWTYNGVRKASSRRVLALLLLRLGALLVVFLLALRPSLASRDELRVPSTLLIAADASESMTILDEYDNQSRWGLLTRKLRECEPLLARLREENNVTVILYRFAGDISEFDTAGKADGKRTDIGQALQTLFERHGHERFLRGVLVLSDGADNGTRFPALPLAAKWRALPCPVHTFAFGKPTTTASHRDLALTAITPEPSPVAVKGKLTIKVIVDAPGFANTTARFRLLLNDQEVLAKDEKLVRAQGNEVRLVCDAPATPGELKVTVKADPLLGELTTANNEISTYVTVTKEGVSVLYVEGKFRAWEPKFIRYALSQDPRIRLYEAVFPQGAPANADLLQLQQQHYDVILLGDVSARRLASGGFNVLNKVHELVQERGVGLLMFGGYEALGNSDWQGTPVAALLPVELDPAGQVEDAVQMVPTPDGLRHYVLRLADKEEDNKLIWSRLRKLKGMTRVGRPKPSATLLAETDGRTPLLVGHKYGEGRVLAFGGDTTERWRNTPEGRDAHARFWKQLVLWLAKQDEAEGSVWVRPDVRRLPAGGKFAFTVGLRGKGGVEIKDGRFEVNVVGPAGGEFAVPTARDRDEERGVYWKTDAPGEYRVVVRGRGKGTEGDEVNGEASARFLVYQDDAEMSRQAADHDFLAKLANAGGGQFYKADDLSQFLSELPAQPLPQSRPKAKLLPDWRRTPATGSARDQFAALAASGTLACFVLFVVLVCTEWFLRRYWGLV